MLKNQQIEEGSRIKAKENAHTAKLPGFVWGSGRLMHYDEEKNLAFFTWKMGANEYSCYCDVNVFYDYFENAENGGTMFSNNRPPVFGHANFRKGYERKFPEEIYNL